MLFRMEVLNFPIVFFDQEKGFQSFDIISNLVQEPGRAEADFGRFDVKTVVRNIYILFSRSEIPIAEKDKEIMDMVDSSSTPLPPWFTEEDLTVYATLYEQSGFASPMQVPYKQVIFSLQKLIL